MTVPPCSLDLIRDHIAIAENHPKSGVLFRDVSPLLASPDALACAIDVMELKVEKYKPTVIVGIESRGLIFGALLARQLGLPFVMARKAGKLPPPVFKAKYELEYGTDTLEIQTDKIDFNDRVVVVDDLLATGGTSLAACSLVEKCKAQVTGIQVLIELKDLNGRSKLKGYPVSSILKF